MRVAQKALKNALTKTVFPSLNITDREDSFMALIAVVESFSFICCYQEIMTFASVVGLCYLLLDRIKRKKGVWWMPRQ